MNTSGNFSFITGILLMLASFISCAEDKDDIQNCLSYETAYVTAVNAPSNAQVGQEVSIQLEFQVHNGCGQFHQFRETETGTGWTIEVEAKYDGCVCTQNAPIIEVPYRFTPKTPGELTLMFLTGEDEYEEIIILVEEKDS